MKLENPFQLIAEKMVFLLPASRHHNTKLDQELTQLSGGERGFAADFQVRRIRETLEAASLVLVLLFVVWISTKDTSSAIEGGKIERPAYGSSDSTYDLNVAVDGEAESEPLSVIVRARQFTPEEAKEKLSAARDELESLLPGENPSLGEVRTALSLPAALQGGAVQADYTVSPPGYIDSDGSILAKMSDIPDPEHPYAPVIDPDGTALTITADLTCRDEKLEYSCGALLLPPVLSADEELRLSLKNAVNEADLSSACDSSLSLPKDVDGHSVDWSYPEDNPLPLLAFLAVIVPIAVWVHSEQSVHDEAKRREEQLSLDYSEFLWKLTMLLSAGLTLRGAFTRICRQYTQSRQDESASICRDDGGVIPVRCVAGTNGRHRDKSGVRFSGRSGQKFAAGSAKNTSRKSGRNSADKTPPRRYLYEELIYTLREMQSGVPEGTAYQNFGRRCGLPSYIKLGSLLAQNLQKGARGLTALLEKEATISMEEHKNAARKLGEKASIKLLLPMILMFTVVLAILMIPAFLSFQG